MVGIITEDMTQRIRIKPYYHILENDGVVSFIKTLDETIRIPSGEVINILVDAIQHSGDYNEVCKSISNSLQLGNGEAEILINKFMELGVIEWHTELETESKSRYHRQQLLFDSMSPLANIADDERQAKLAAAHVMIIGIGGIGNYIAMALAAAGIGKLTIVDFDVVEMSNMNRQVLFRESNLGQPKIPSAVEQLKSLNSTIIISGIETKIDSLDAFEKLVKERSPVNYVVLSADHPPHLVLWASALCRKHNFHYMKCGYMAHQGLIGPLLGPDTPLYEELFESWKPVIESQPDRFRKQNEAFIAPSMAATNGILANIAALEMIKDITGIAPSCLKAQRLLLNMKTMELTYG